MKMFKPLGLSLLVSACLVTGSAHASLVAFQQYVGKIGYSTDGFGSTLQSGTISALVPAGSTVIAAYLYTSTFYNPTLAGINGSTLNGNLLSFTGLGVNTPSCCDLVAARVNVTSIVKPLIDGGVGGVYNFALTESSASQDGEALVVVYSNPILGISTVGILDGFASVTGDTTSISFATPLNPAVPGFSAELALGIGYSYNTAFDSQVSTVKVNNAILTTVAGNYDDGEGDNGGLITVGGFDDGFSPINPADYTLDHERYNLTSFINAGDTSIRIDTINSSLDDNIFLAVVKISGEGVIDPPAPVPEPGSLALFAIAIAGLITLRKQQCK